jgi:hypothetical protein
MKLESIEHARFRALAQIIVDQEKGVDAFEEYMKLAFPYLEASQKRDRQRFIDVLKQETGMGPMRVREIQQPKAQSRLKKRIVRSDAKPATEKHGKLYDKLGNVVPL